MNTDQWIEINQKWCKTFRFSDFSSAMAFMVQVAFAAERMDHHPRWTNEYNLVHFELSTHSAGNRVTEKDHQLANAIDQIFTSYQ